MGTCGPKGKKNELLERTQNGGVGDHYITAGDLHTFKAPFKVDMGRAHILRLAPVAGGEFAGKYSGHTMGFLTPVALESALDEQVKVKEGPSTTTTTTIRQVLAAHNIKPVMMMYAVPEYEDAKSVWEAGVKGKERGADLQRLEQLRASAGKVAEKKAEKEAKEEAAKAEAKEEAIKDFNNRWFRLEVDKEDKRTVEEMAGEAEKQPGEKSWWKQLRAVRDVEQNDQLWTDADLGVLTGQYRGC